MWWESSGREALGRGGSTRSETGEWDEMEADGCGFGEEGTLMVKAGVKTPLKGSLQKILILLSSENP